MKIFPWLIAGLAVGAAVAVVAMMYDEQTFADSDAEHAANNIGAWGAKQRFTGAGSSMAGKVKQAVGDVTGNNDLQAEGIGDQIVGGVKDAAGKAASAVSETIHDFHRS